MRTASGWRNFDASPTLGFERLPILGRLYTKNNQRFPQGIEYGDIVEGLPVKPESCRGIYTSHVLEHLCLEDCRKALQAVYSLLRPGGIFRLVVPDLKVLASTYLGSNNQDAAHEFMQKSMLGIEKKPRTMIEIKMDFWP